MREEVIETIAREKIVAIIRGVPRDRTAPLLSALYAGGIRVAEITFDPAGGIPDVETASLIGEMAAAFRGKMVIGAGTVLSPEQADLVADVGGAFTVSPDTCAAVIDRSRERDLVSIPGAMTPSEIAAACRAGADFVKLFPAAVCGPEYVKMVKAPFAGVRLLAFGGIGAGDMAAYLAAGASGFGIGAGIVDPTLLQGGDLAAITARAQAYVQVLGN